MARIIHQSTIPRNLPQWLLNVQAAVEDISKVMQVQGDEHDYKNLKSFIDSSIEAQRSRGNLNSHVETELRYDEGKTVIMIFRNKVLMQTYRIE
ncbi:MAG: hypothetical protein WCS17_04010 [Prevotella sp.]